MGPGSGVVEREWLEFAAELMAAPLTELPVEPIAVQLARSLDAVACAFSSQQQNGPLVADLYPVTEAFGGHRAAIEELAPTEAPRVHPILHYYRATGSGVSIQVADVPEQLVPVGVVPAWYELARPWGCADQLALPMEMRAGGHRSFVIGRDAPFTPRELDVARRVRRLLTGLDRQVQALARLRSAPDLAVDFRLTPRELSVLGLLVEGLTAGAIGRRLQIGERTVQKHLEHAYTKLGVGDRLSAVLRAQQLGLLRSSA